MSSFLLDSLLLVSFLWVLDCIRCLTCRRTADTRKKYYLAPPRRRTSRSGRPSASGNRCAMCSDPNWIIVGSKMRHLRLMHFWPSMLVRQPRMPAAGNCCRLLRSLTSVRWKRTGRTSISNRMLMDLVAVLFLFFCALCHTPCTIQESAWPFCFFVSAVCHTPCKYLLCFCVCLLLYFTWHRAVLG